MTFIDRNIKYLRFINGISQQKLADALGLTKGTISLYERFGKVSLESQQKLADYFGYTVKELNDTPMGDAATIIQQGNDNVNVVNNGTMKANTTADIISEQREIIAEKDKRIYTLEIMMQHKEEIIQLLKEKLKNQ